MRKINRIWYVICLVAGLSLFITVYPFRSEVEAKAWFRYASKYDRARSKMIANEAARTGTIMQNLAKANTLKQEFLQVEPPTEDEVVSVLRSPNRKLQRVGLAAMCLRPIETDQLIELILEFLQDPDRDFRLYAAFSLDAFTEFPESKKAELGRQLLEIIKKEEEKGLFLQEFSLLATFPSEEAVVFLTEQLMKEGKDNLHFRYFAFDALKKMGDSFYDEAAEYVNKHSSPEIKREILEWENSWERINTPTGKR